jgi:alanine racemase
MFHRDVYRPTWAEIDLDALARNLHSIRDFIGEGIKVMGVVKANAYGHGAVECSRRLEAEGVDWLGVATVEEAVELREAGVITPILSFGSFWPGQEQLLFHHNITPAVFDLERAGSLDAVARELGITKNVHLKIDTGMGRVGVSFRDVAEWAEALRKSGNLHVEGLMTHFAAADDLTDEFTNTQMLRFAEAVSIFHEKGFRPTILDMANSPGAVGHSDSRATMARIGGILYGLGDDVLPIGIPRPNLEPVMSVHSRIAFLKKVPAGENIGYGKTFTTERESMIATVPIGYHDGFRRALSNKGSAIVNGDVVPVVGRVSMDWITIDVTGLPNVGVSDEVVLIGSQGQRRITAGEIAHKCDTISYEITCGLSSRVPRVFVSTSVD